MNANAAVMSDRFSIIQLTSSHILSGLLMRITELPITVLTEPPVNAPREVAQSQVEVYFLDNVFQEAPADIGRSDVYFFNDAALEVCRRYGIDLPKPSRTIARGGLPHSIGTLLTFPIR